MTRTRILVVEDNSQLRALYGAALQGHDLEVVTARDGMEAKELVALMPPSVVITDLDMPRCDGLDLVKSLRNAGIAVPVLIVTGSHPSDPRLVAARDLGAEVHMKPVRMGWLRMRACEAALAAPPVPVPEPLADVDGLRRREEAPVVMRTFPEPAAANAAAGVWARAELWLALAASLAGVAAVLFMTATGALAGGLDPFAAQIVNRCLGVVSAAVLGGAWLHVRRHSAGGSRVLWAGAVVWWVLTLTLPAAGAAMLPVGALAALAATAGLAPKAMPRPALP